MSKIMWFPSCEGYVDSHCGQFDIVPFFEGTTRAQSYGLYETHPLTLYRKMRGTHDTQLHAKVYAQEIVNGSK